MITPRKRQGRWHRNPALARKRPLDAIKHGEQILALLDQTQFLTATQVAHRFFTVPIQGERKAETELARASRAANRSLSRLKDRGWVELLPVFTMPKPRMLRTIEVNALTREGVQTVTELYERTWQQDDVRPFSNGLVNPLPETVLHDLAVRDALIFLTRLVDGAGLPVHWFTMGSRELIQQGRTAMTHAPDLIIVAGDKRIPLLVEVDLGTESISSRAPNSWASKYARYADYLQRDFGNDPLFEGCGKPLVLVLGTSTRRVNNLITAIEDWGGQRAWWFATLEAISPLIYYPPGHLWRVTTADAPLSLTEALGLRPRL